MPGLSGAHTRTMDFGCRPTPNLCHPTKSSSVDLPALRGTHRPHHQTASFADGFAPERPNHRAPCGSPPTWSPQRPAPHVTDGSQRCRDLGDTRGWRVSPQADRQLALEKFNTGQIDPWCWNHLKRLRFFNLHWHKIHTGQVGQNKLSGSRHAPPI